MVKIEDLDYEFIFHVGVPLVNRVKCNHLIGTPFDSVINIVYDPNNMSDYYHFISVQQKDRIVCEKSISRDAKFLNAIL
jgi:hypothetical protein